MKPKPKFQPGDRVRLLDYEDERGVLERGIIVSGPRGDGKTYTVQITIKERENRMEAV
jgi:predicted AAA+ superfamily ATPase